MLIYFIIFVCNIKGGPGTKRNRECFCESGMIVDVAAGNSVVFFESNGTMRVAGTVAV